jgi:Tol biopolymer transport system component
MFITLYLKEWKEKFGILVFGIGILALFFGVDIGLTKNAEAREPVMGVVLVFFFPVMALLLGAGGFEPESHNDAWAYLFSRPVGKGTIWAAKFLSLLSQLACLCLLFLMGMITVPGLKSLAAGFRLPVAFGTELSFLPWSLLVSLFLFSIAFSLSPFSKRWINLFFGAFFIGLLLAFIAYEASTFVTALLPDKWLDEEKWLHAFRWSLILMSGASILASLLTLMREDFSQPRKKIGRFAGYAAPFAVVALVIAAAWTALLPRSGERYLSLVADVNGRAYFDGTPGIFEYDSAKDKVRRIAGSGFILSFFEPGHAPASSGEMLAVGLGRPGSDRDSLTLWIMNADGSRKKQLLGPGLPPDDPRSRLAAYSTCLSPDAKRIAFIDENAFRKPLLEQSPLWSMNADGTGLKNHRVDSAVFKEDKDYYIRLAAWTGSRDAVLISQLARRSGIPARLWLANLNDGTSRVLLEFVAVGWYVNLSPSGRVLAVPYKIIEKGNFRLAIALADLDTLEIKTIEVNGDRSIFRLNWSPVGDKLAFFARKGTARETGAYILEVVSVPGGKILASREMTTDERTGQLYDIDWLKDGARLVLSDPVGRCLKILGANLDVERTISNSTSLRSPWSIMVSGDKILANDNEPHRIWRFDLSRNSWKRIY